MIYYDIRTPYQEPAHLTKASDQPVAFDLGGIRFEAWQVTSTSLPEGDHYLATCYVADNKTRPPALGLYAGADSLPLAFVELFKQFLQYDYANSLVADAIAQVAWHHMHLARLADAVAPLLDQREAMASLLLGPVKAQIVDIDRRQCNG